MNTGPINFKMTSEELLQFAFFLARKLDVDDLSEICEITGRFVANYSNIPHFEAEKVKEEIDSSTREFNPFGDTFLCTLSAENGKLDTLKNIREHGDKWDENPCLYKDKTGNNWDELTCAYAAKNGHLEVLKYLRENGCPWGDETSRWAAENGHLEVLKYAIQNGCPMDGWTREYVAKNGYLRVL